MCCIYDSNARKHEFINATTERTYLSTLLKKTKCDLVVMEACGPSGWINDLAISLGHITLVCSTNEDAWKWSNVRRKTDKEDALKLARMAAMAASPSVEILLRVRVLSSALGRLFVTTHGPKVSTTASVASKRLASKKLPSPLVERSRYWLGPCSGMEKTGILSRCSASLSLTATSTHPLKETLENMKPRENSDHCKSRLRKEA